MAKHICAALVALPLLFGSVPMIGGVTAAFACEVSTACDGPATIVYNGTSNVRPTLKPEVCIVLEAKNLMDLLPGPGVDFWFTYYQRYSVNGREDDMEPVMRTDCITEQWVVPGARIGFWFDCHDPVDGVLKRFWYETGPITDNGHYDMVFLKKARI